MKRVLVTGAGGFIGSRVIQVLKGEHEVYGLVRELPRDADEGIGWIVQNLDKAVCRRDLPEKIDGVIHLAQSRKYKDFPGGARDMFEVNIRATFELLEYARQAGASCFIFASTGGVYGYSYEKFTETDPVNPLNFYLSSKYASELLLGNYQQFFRTIVFRFFFVYGPGQKGMLIPNLMDKVRRGEEITVEGNPGLRINPIYVDDAVQVFQPGLECSRSDLFNVAGDESVTITDLMRLIEQAVGNGGTMKYIQGISKGDLVGDNRRMKEILKVQPRFSLLEGLKRMV